MDENKNEAVAAEKEENTVKSAAATKEEKAKLIAQRMSSISFEDEVIEDNGDRQVDDALKKVTQAVNGMDRTSSSAVRRANGEENDMAQRRNGAQSRNKNGARRPSQERPGGTRRPNTQARSSDRKRKPVKKKKKSKAPLIALLSILGAIVLFCAIGYIVGVNKYKGVFLDNTFINNLNVSGKSKEETYNMVKEKSALKDSITIVRLDGNQISLPLKDIGYEDKTEYEIEKFYNSQNHYNWIGSKFKNTQFELTEKFEYDKTKLEAVLKKTMTSASTGKDPVNATIQKSSDGSGYVIIKEKPGDKINLDKIKNLYDYVEQNLDKGTYVIDVAGVDCYETAKITSDSLKEQCDRLNQLDKINITLDFIHSKETISGDKIADWVNFDSKDKNGIIVDNKKVEAYVETLAEKYDTYCKDRQFKTTKKGVITIKGGSKNENDTGCYGWWIDQQKTTELIAGLITQGTSTSTKPVYYQNPYNKYIYECNEAVWTKDKDYGNTYVEIDIAAQHMWFYKDGKIAKEFDIVSGYLYDKNRYTREGVYKVWSKQSPSRLKGAGWDVKVSYWTNFSLYGAGFHDASWQYGVFGGNKYKTSGGGSHGCINMSLEGAKYVYENVPINTPVFVYNIEKAADGAATKPN